MTQFRSRLQLLTGKAYQHLPAKDREPMTISLFATGLIDFRLAEQVLTQAPETLSEAERIALENLQIRRGINSARPRIRRKEPMPSLLADSQPSGETSYAEPDQDSEQAPPTRSRYTPAMRTCPSSSPSNSRPTPRRAGPHRSQRP